MPRLVRWIHPSLALVAGALLRLWFIGAYPVMDGDPLIYGDIAKNLLLHGVYGLTRADGIHPTLIRLPGYPLFLALCFRLFGMEHYHAVMFVQLAIDLAACLLVASIARRLWSRRAGLAALWLAALCPFTANYVAAPLTETLSIFCVALALWALLRLLDAPGPIPVAALIFAFSYAALLRPDGPLLAVALCPAIWVCSLRRASALRPARALRLAIVCGLLSALPFLPWTLRNWRTFHVFQPLAPRSASDPGEPLFPGFYRWTRTWCVEFTSTNEIYWTANGDRLDIDDLPTRAFDSPEQYEQTRRLFDDYNRNTTITPEIDARFNAIAAERIRGHRLRYFVALPLARLANMWFRPRTENLWIELRWWEFDQHHSETEFAAAYAALNALYLLAALAGLARCLRPGISALTPMLHPMLWPMLAFVLLRCALLATIDAPEPRYTLECFPIVFVLAAILFGGEAPSTY